MATPAPLTQGGAPQQQADVSATDGARRIALQMLQERGRGAVLVGVAKVDAALEHLIQAVRAPAPNGCCASGWIARLEALIAMPIVSLPAKGAIDQIVGTYPIGTFRLLKTNDLRQFGECLTQRMVLEAWDRLFGS